MQSNTLAVIQLACERAAAGEGQAAVALLNEALPEAGEARATVHHILATLHAAQGDLGAALEHYAAAESIGGLTAEMALERGELLRGADLLAASLKDYDLVLQALPEHRGARLARALVLGRLDRQEEALADYDVLCSHSDVSAQIFNNRGIVLQALGRHASALESYDRAIALSGTYALAHFNRASVLAASGRTEEAAAAYGMAASLGPALPEAWNARGALFADAHRYAEALADFDRALQVRPNYAEALNNRSIALRRLERFDEALQAAEAALGLRPDWPPALNSFAAAMMKLGRFDDAVSVYDGLLAIQPECSSAWLNRAIALESLGRLQDALASFARARDLAPEDPDPEFNGALCHLRAGDLRTGFELYEARWRRRCAPDPRHPLHDRLWTGEQPIAGRRLLVHAEQGFGDAIQFCRFIKNVKALGPEVIFDVPPGLRPLMTGCEGWDSLTTPEQGAPEFDLHVPLMSLPRVLGVTLEHLTGKPYLAVPPDRSRAWRDRLPAYAGPRIGLAWSGNPQHQNDCRRSITFEALAPLLDAPAQFVSLQREHRASDGQAIDRFGDLVVFGAELRDFADTAALACCCDVVIAVDTAVAHLAGAIGRPLWLLLPRPGDWRWMEERRDSPWYGSARIYRQTRFDDWAGVIAEVARDLREHCARA